MKIERADIKIIDVLDTSDDWLSTTEIAKEVFRPEDRQEMKKYDNKVRTRMKKFERHDWVRSKEESGRTVYDVRPDKVMSAEGEIYTKPKGNGERTRRVRFKIEMMVVAMEPEYGEGIYIYTYIPTKEKGIRGLRLPP